MGIGTSSPDNKFVVAEGTNQHGVEIAPGTISYIQAYDRAVSGYGDLKIDAKTLTFRTDNGFTRLTIDSAGKSTFTGGIKIDAGTIQLDDVAESIDFLQSGAINFDSNNDQLVRTLTIGSGRAGGISGGTTHLTISEDTGVTEIAKVVETNGVLKENLLTNSGFDVWSNSTLEDVTGTNLISTWTAGGYDNFTLSGSNITSAIDASGAVYAITDAVSTFTDGKLYEITYNLTLNSGEAPYLGTANLAISDGGALAPTQLSTGANTIVIEASSDSTHQYLKLRNDAATSFALTIDIKEVTPGIVSGTAGPDGWRKDSTLDIFREQPVDRNTPGNTKDGSFYALKTTSGAAGDWLSYPSSGNANLDWTQRFAGRTITMGCWAKTSTANHCEVYMFDGTGSTSSGYHTGGGDWEWLEVTKTFAGNPTYAEFNIKFNVTSTDAYISQVIVVYGSAIGEGNYSRPSGEIVWCESVFPLNGYNGTASVSSDTDLNLEAISDGKIPKGIKAVSMQLSGECATVEKYLGFAGLDAGTNSGWLYSQVANVNNATGVGLISCDSVGDISLARDDTFNLVRLRISGVQL